MDVEYERLSDADKPEVMRLLEIANMHHIPSAEMPAVSWSTYTVARMNGQVVGFAGYKVLSETEAKTELMVVDPVCRGLGVGMRLQTIRMNEMAAKGIQTLTTNSDLPASIAWYKKHFGYVEVGRLDKEHEFGSPDIDFWTTLRIDLKQWAESRQDDDHE